MDKKFASKFNGTLVVKSWLLTLVGRKVSLGAGPGAAEVSAACSLLPPWLTKGFVKIDICRDLCLGSQYLPRYC
eukprot:495689-Pelagomonas_calceolata.AAC.1